MPSTRTSPGGSQFTHYEKNHVVPRGRCCRLGNVRFIGAGRAGERPESSEVTKGDAPSQASGEEIGQARGQETGEANQKEAQGLNHVKLRVGEAGTNFRSGCFISELRNSKGHAV